MVLLLYFATISPSKTFVIFKNATDEIDTPALRLPYSTFFLFRFLLQFLKSWLEHFQHAYLKPDTPWRPRTLGVPLKLVLLYKHNDTLANKEDECVQIWRQTAEIVSTAGARSGPSEWWCRLKLVDRWLSGLDEASFRYSSTPRLALPSSPGTEHFVRSHFSANLFLDVA